jgi:hypothetical protein
MIPTGLIIVALLLALVAEARERGEGLLGYAVAFLAIALLWGRV